MKLIIVLDNVRSAFNVGSAFRTADGLGAEIHLVGMTPIPGKDKKLDKTSLLALDSVEWKYFDDFNGWFKHLNQIQKTNDKHNVIISVEENKELKTVSLFDIEKNIDLLQTDTIYLIFGHEINGVSQDFQNKSDFVLQIPMYGKKNSLNVATCVGIVGYRVKEVITQDI